MNSIIKLFRKNENGSIRSFPYDSSQNYYSYVQGIINKGYSQCIFTTDIMLKMAEHFILEEDGVITAIRLYEDDDELYAQLLNLIKLLKTNKAYWNRLKETISYLKDDSVDIDEMEICGRHVYPYKVSLHVNGIVELQYEEEDDLQDRLVNIVGAYIK